MFKMTVQGDTLADLGRNLADAARALEVVPAATGNAPAPSAAKPSRQTKPSTPDTSARTEEAGAEAGETAPEPESTASASEPQGETEQSVTYDDVRKLVGKLAQAKGREAAAAVLEGLGVDHAQKLTEAQWPSAVAKLTEALGE